MANATVIDQLIIKLGLDPDDFDKGRKKVAAGVLDTEAKVKKSTQGMGRDFVAFGGKMLGVVTVAAAVKKGLSFVSDVSKTVRQLGIDSRNFGIAANELRNFQNVSEMFGGKAEETTRTVGNLTKAVYDLAYNGVISDSLVTLGRLGVRFQDTSGDARDFKDIVLDTEKAVQRLSQSGHSKQNLNQMLLQAGFDPGLAQAILEGRVGQELGKQQSRRQVTGEVVRTATEWERSATNRDQAIEAATLRVLPAQAAAGKFGNDKLAAGAEGLSDATLSGSLEAISSALETGGKAVAKATNSFVDSIEESAAQMLRNSYPKGRANYERQIQQSAARYGIDPEVLAGVLSTESNFDPSAKSGAGAVGIAQLMPKYFPKAGRSPNNDINDAARYLSQLRDDFAKEGYDPGDTMSLALSSYNAGQTRVRNAMLGKGPALKQETLDYPGKVLGYAAGATPTPGAQNSVGNSGGSSSEVNIGKVEIVTQATDANGIAEDITPAMRRKMLAAQADAGMN